MKLVIDIPETAYEAFKDWHKNKVATVEQSLIAQGIPYEERPHGEWILDAVVPHSISWFRCSYCGYKYEAYKQSNFCPNCGADMRPKEGESE